MFFIFDMFLDCINVLFFLELWKKVNIVLLNGFFDREWIIGRIN